MRQKVGRLTLAAALIVAGGLLVFDNLTNAAIAGAVARLWPALLILLGLEWLWATSRLQPDEKARMDGGAILLLIIVAVVAAAAGNQWHTGTLHVNPPRFEFNPGAIAPLGNVASPEILLRDDNAGSNLQTVSVQSGPGNITVQTGEKFGVVLRVRAYGRTMQDAEQNARRVSLQVTPGTTTEVRANWPQNLNRIDLDFTITVPKGVTLQLASASGDIRVSNTDGRLIAQSASGSIIAQQINGNVDLHSASGSVTATRITGDLSAGTSSGHITAGSITGKTTGTSTSGKVEIQDAGGAVTATTVSGSLEVNAAKVAGDYQLRTTSGHATLSLPADAAVTVKAKSNSGNVSGPSWLTLGEGRNSGSGTQGAGTYKVTIDTTSGAISIGSH